MQAKHKERAIKQKSLFAPPRKEGSEPSFDAAGAAPTDGHGLASRSPPGSPIRTGTSLAAAAAGTAGPSSLSGSARVDSPGGRPRLQLARRTKPLPKLEIKQVAAPDDDDVDGQSADRAHRKDSAAGGSTPKANGSNAGRGDEPSGPGGMKILARPKEQQSDDKKEGKGRVIDVAASKRLISGALGGSGGKGGASAGSGKGSNKPGGGARVIGKTEVVSSPNGTVEYRITIGDGDDDHDDESASASSSTGPSKGRGSRRGRGRGSGRGGSGGGGGRGGKGRGGRGRGQGRGGDSPGGGGRGGGNDGEKGKAPKNEKKQHRAPSRYEKQSDGSVKLYKGKSKGSGKGGSAGNKQTGSKPSSLSAAAAKSGGKGGKK